MKIMERCKTCKHWDRVKEGEYGSLPGSGACRAAVPIWEATEDAPPDYETRQLLPEHAGLLCMVADGSQYAAHLITMADFGCVMHEPAPPVSIPP